jgi:hypothetical protein
MSHEHALRVDLLILHWHRMVPTTRWIGLLPFDAIVDIFFYSCDRMRLGVLSIVCVNTKMLLNRINTAVSLVQISRGSLHVEGLDRDRDILGSSPFPRKRGTSFGVERLSTRDQGAGAADADGDGGR